MSLHFALGTSIDEAFGDRLSAPPELLQDALVIRLENGIVLTIRYAAPDAYSLRWILNGSEFGIDTAPLHRGLKTFPNHYHDAEGVAHADPITNPSASPEENLSRLITSLLDEQPRNGAESGTESM